MANEDANKWANQMLQFNLKLAHWNRRHFEHIFNINGKGGGELTRQQFHLLIIIHEMDIHTLSKLTKFLDISKSSLSLTISKLVSEGFLEKKLPSQQDDGRKVYFYVTEKGTHSLEQVHQEALRNLANFYVQLDEDKKEDLKIGLEKLSHVYN